MTTEKIAEILRLERIKQNMSIEALSELSGVSIGAISMFERQVRTNIGIDYLLAWISALGLSTSNIFGSSDSDVINSKLDMILKKLE